MQETPEYALVWAITKLTVARLSSKAATAKQQQGFDNLDNQIKQFISDQAENYRNISKKIIQETAGVKKEITAQAVMLGNQISDQAQARIEREQRLLFLGSLQFPTMRQRKNRVPEAHYKTFGWIFDKNISGPWDSFTAWLKSQERVYWISGKPGSGKSTLVKYLVDKDTTTEMLREWDPSVTILSFFLWSSGGKLQKSIQGLLCALLSQILHPDEELTCTLMAGDPGLLEKRTYDDWSDEELESLLVKAISTSKRRVCMFLDGLDEIDRKEGPFPLVKLVETLESKTGAKLCLSSRPEAEFQDVFGTQRTLRLEDLTRKDIGEYVNDYFQKHLKFWEGSEAGGQSWREKITDEILKRASGVFLWVFLVLRSLRRGSSGVDSYDELHQRIIHLPPDLKQLYQQAWQRQGENEQIYRDEAASYFKLLLQSQQMRDVAEEGTDFAGIPLSLLEYLLAHDSQLRENFLGSRLIPPAKVLISKAREFRRRVETRTGGLLEVFRSDESSPENEKGALSNAGWFLRTSSINFFNQFLVPFSVYLDLRKGGLDCIPGGRELAELWNVSHSLSIGFIHRTAADFVSESDWGNSLICRVQMSDQDIQTSLCEARLAHSLLHMFPSHQHTNATYCARANDFSILFNNIRSSISQAQYISLWQILQRTHMWMIESSPRIDNLIEDLSTQIREGEFGSEYYRTMYEFIESGLIHSFELVWAKDENASPTGSANPDFEVIKNMPSLAELCRQILANCRSGRSDPLAGRLLAGDLGRFPLPGEILTRSSSMSRIAAHVVFGTWMLADSRDWLRSQIVRLLGTLSLSASQNGMSECLQHCMDRWPDIYKITKGFKRALMCRALFLQPAYKGNVVSTSVAGYSSVRQLLSAGGDPNLVFTPYPHKSIPLTLFEWFLLDVPARCQEEQLPGVESSIILTIKAFLDAAARMDRRICLAFRGPSSVPLRAVCSPTQPAESQDQALAYEFIVETDSIQLLDRAKTAIQACSKKWGTPLNGFDDLPDTHRSFSSKVLGILEVPKKKAELHYSGRGGHYSDRESHYSGRESGSLPGPTFFLTKREDMELMAERFKVESSRSPEEWADGGSDFTPKTRELIESITSRGGGYEISSTTWLHNNGHVMQESDGGNRGILNGIGLEYREAGSHLYEKWFPDWAKMTTSYAHIDDEQAMALAEY
jgi:hypothetical protein